MLSSTFTLPSAGPVIHMHEIPPTAAMRRWTVSVDGGLALFRCAPWLEDHTADRVLPRLWPGRGFGVSDTDAPGLAAAVAETMKAPAYWTASHRVGRRWQDQPWAPPRLDPDDRFLYLAGPCGKPDDTAGYRPAYHLPIALPDLRGLPIRLTAHLRAATPDRV
ncbi:hypothetical protein ATK30_8582 [Amycolatopsis echigonensis]|uniref:Uncharacterized protein n=1 Tax=Amycolatopsis echigonensis TaxID=2576905 RepID=A0A2N3WUP2_9PSEU|nr:hypothetical protein [Amycolatopsis niigatensis]PKV97596.1 hypothetical protein ATK30_8582 [Amycolatopsis niigatensis]